MREIIFRVWDKQEKKMIYPTEKDNEDKSISAWTDSEDDKFVIMQYTGMDTKDGEKIFEDDIIDGKFRGIGIVKFMGSCFHLVSMHFWQYIGRLVEPTIIGNIHENQNLIPKDMQDDKGSLSESWRHPWDFKKK